MRFILILSQFFLAFLLAFNANAETVFMVQLGSYETKSDADAKWLSLKEENASLLKNLKSITNQVQLPPADEIVYRLQAGPIDSRINAKSLCEKLSSSNETCFVMETAMFNGENTNQIASKAAPVDTINTTSSFESSPNKPSLFSSTSNVFSEFGESLVSSLSDDEEPNQISALAPVDGTDDVSIDEEMTVEVAETIPDTSLNTEETVASSESQTTNTSQNNALPWLNKPIMMGKESAPVASTEKVISKNTFTTQSDAYIPSGSGNDSKNIAAEIVNASQSRGTMESAVVMQQLPGVQMVDYKNDIPIEIAKPSTNLRGEGKVEVSEAVAVPLSQMQQDDLTTSSSNTISSGSTKPLGFEGVPSNKTIGKTYWVKLNYFTNEATAANFYANLRNNNPQKARNLRMRITQPYYALSKTNSRVSLELGPLPNTDEVDELCALSATQNLVCEMQKDTNRTSTSPNPPLSPTALAPHSDTASSRYHARTRNVASTQNSYWVQLGSYRNRGDALAIWNEMKRNNNALKSLQPHFEQPAYSSASQTIYRLRTGPFVTQAAADALCQSVSNATSACLVVKN